MNPTRPLLAVAAVAALALTGCAGDAAAPATAPTESEGLTSITVGVSPDVMAATMYLAEEKGYFEEVGLKPEFVVQQAGASAIPQLLSGDLDIAINDAAGSISASRNGVPVTIIGIAAQLPSADKPDFAAVVSADASLTDPLALQGKTIATHQINGIPMLNVAVTIDKLGGDSSSINWVEVPIPNMVDTVAAGTVDGAVVPEPFLTMAKQEGQSVVLRPQQYIEEGQPATVFTASHEYVTQHPDVVERFTEAIGKAAKDANADRQTVVDIAGYTGLPQPLLEAIGLPQYAENTADVEGIRTLVATMLSYKYLDGEPDFDTLLAKPQS